jgi:hypothetical protein
VLEVAVFVLCLLAVLLQRWNLPCLDSLGEGILADVILTRLDKLLEEHVLLFVAGCVVQIVELSF